MPEAPLNSDQISIYCMHCGTRNDSVDYACGRCGERLYIPDPERPPPLGFMSCTSCASANESHASYCATCGSELDHSTRISPDGADSYDSEQVKRERSSIWPPLPNSGFGRRRRDDQSPVTGGDVPVRRPRNWRLARRRQSQRHRRRPIPREIQRWNWSAFILGPIWGVWHRIWWSALGLLPLLPFIVLPRQMTIAVWVLVALLLGLKGNELAWRARKWESVEKFMSLQQRWHTWSVMFAVGALIGAIVLLLSGGL